MKWESAAKIGGYTAKGSVSTHFEFGGWSLSTTETGSVLSAHIGRTRYFYMDSLGRFHVVWSFDAGFGLGGGMKVDLGMPSSDD